MTNNVTITARIHDRCPHRACLVVPVPPDPTDLFPGLFAGEVVVLCAACVAAEEAIRAAHDTARMLAAHDDDSEQWTVREDSPEDDRATAWGG